MQIENFNQLAIATGSGKDGEETAVILAIDSSYQAFIFDPKAKGWRRLPKKIVENDA